MQERHSDRERYFDEQARTTEKYYIPYIRKCCPELPQEVLEVGCGEGGNLFSFAQLGCSVTGVDIAAGRIAEARKFFAERGAEGTFIASDIFKSVPASCAFVSEDRTVRKSKTSSEKST